MDVDIGISTLVGGGYGHGFIDTGADIAPVYRHWCGCGHMFIDTGVGMDICLSILV